MSVRQKTLAATPIGRAHKASARSIWQRIGEWSVITIKHNLNELANAGIVVRTTEPTPTGIKHFYYRSAGA